MKIKSNYLGFIADEKLQDLTRESLNEVERAYSANAPKAGLLLSVSSIEGILYHIIDIRSSELQSQSFWPNNPRTHSKLDFKDIKFVHMIDICIEAHLLPARFKDRLHEVRKYRNYIHPPAELKSGETITLGKSQSAGALLNELILIYPFPK